MENAKSPILIEKHLIASVFGPWKKAYAKMISDIRRDFSLDWLSLFRSEKNSTWKPLSNINGTTNKCYKTYMDFRVSL
jgi:hypothetical protein